MVNATDAFLSLLIPAVVLLHLITAPYTKVEESFNIQAIHDIIVYGVPSPFSGDASDYIRTHYDHATFPGAVPRTFVGAAVLSGLARPFVGFLSSPAQIQVLVRAILGLLNALTLVRFRAAVDVAYGRTAGRFYLVFVASQFHLVFYASRTLPNTLALPLTTEALRAFLLSLSTSPKLRPSSRRRRLSLYLLAAAAILFRAELAILLLTTAATYYLFARLSIRSELLPALLASSLIALPLTLGLDTLLWLPRLTPSISAPWTTTFPLPLWPELQGFLFNFVSGHSSSWGVSSWHWYFTSALPRLLLNPLTYTLCVPLSMLVPAQRRTSIALLLPSLGFVAAYSLLPHKEARFILYTLPSLTAASAGGAAYIFTRRAKSVLYRLLALVVLVSIPLSFLASSSLLALSAHNYPGGHALAALHRLVPLAPRTLNLDTTDAGRGVKVHLSNLALQSGVDRFQELHRARDATAEAAPPAAAWVYDKTDAADELLDPLFWQRFDYAVVEHREKAVGAWHVLATQRGYVGVGLRLDASHVARRGEELGVDEEEVVLFPLWLLPVTPAPRWLEQGLGQVAMRVTRGYWPHVRLGTRLYVLRRGAMPV